MIADETVEAMKFFGNAVLLYNTLMYYSSWS